MDSFDLFLEKSRELKQSRFYNFIKQNKGIKTKVKWAQDEDELIFLLHPDDESVKAFVITLRLFIKSNESCSIKKIKDKMINLKVSENILKNFNNSYESFQRYLDETNVIYNGKVITNRIILDTFINGKYAHTDKNKRLEIDYWKKDESGYLFRFGSFCGILYNYMRLIFHITNLIENFKKNSV